MGKILTPTAGQIATLLGYDGTDFAAVLIDAARRLQVDVNSSALPSGAATAANQAIIATLLDLIELKTTALQLDGNGHLEVKAFDPHDVVGETVSNLTHNAGTIDLDSTAVPAGKIYEVFNIAFWDVDNNITAARLNVLIDGDARRILNVEAITSNTYTFYTNHIFLGPGDNIIITFVGTTANDRLYLAYMAAVHDLV